MSGDAVDAAFVEFPELRRLADLAAGDWIFNASVRDGEVALVKGARGWQDGAADAIVVLGPVGVHGFRLDAGNMRLWECAGGLEEVVGALLALPSPGDRSAPRLILGHAPKLWVPPVFGGLR